MKPKSSANYGIQADNIQAQAIAAGPHAQAVATAREPDAAIRELTEALRQLQLPAEHQGKIAEQVSQLSKEPAAQHKSTIDKIVSIASEAGHLAALVAPLKAVAAAFGVPLPF
jgi:hypothetical protein